MAKLEGRRPLKVREVGLAVSVANWLASKNLTPNQISVASIGFAILGSMCLLMLPNADGVAVWWLPLGAAFFIQCRLLCNLFDGMVAVEGGKRSPAGELFNDLPDRLADPLILVAAGYSAAGFVLMPTIGWLAGIFAIMTAYVRLLAASTGNPMLFQGPMAKQQRMAVMTVACVLWPIAHYAQWHDHLMLLALVIIVLGSIYTVFIRTRDAYNTLTGDK